jgi:hypothetical protein
VYVSLMIAAGLWLSSLRVPPPPPPTAGVPRNEVPRNVRPWREPVTTQPTTQTCDPPPATEKK